MLITDLKVHKLDKTDPRHALAREGGMPITQVYLIECTMEDGSQQEAAYCIEQHGSDFTPRHAHLMLRQFSDAVLRMDEQKAAA